jgi:cold shock CspA family protein
MLLAWDFKYMDAQEEERETRTSQALLDEVTYPVMMHQVIDDRSKRNDPLVSGLFVRPKDNRLATPSSSMNVPTETNDQNHGTIQNLKSGFGFIAPRTGGTNLFFHFTEVLNADFNDLRVGAPVIYRLGRNDRGTCAVQVQA